MAITWRDEDIQRVFVCEKPCLSEVRPGQDVFIVDYAGKLLKYSFWFQVTDECVMISGDDACPFGAHSLYEIVVPCDSVSVCEDPYDPNQTGLTFWYGDPTQRMNHTMMLLKRPDGDLKVWPTVVWPERHAYQQRMLESDPNARNRYNLRSDD